MPHCTKGSVPTRRARRPGPRVVLGLLLAGVAGIGCTPTPDAGGGASDAVSELSGPAMGTRYTIRVPGELPRGRRRSVASAVEAELRRLDEALSTWRPDSDLSRFNAAATTAWQDVATDTARVAALALEVARRSGGALDPTVAPLVDLWGFGPAGPVAGPPDDAAVAAALARTGYGGIEVRPSPPALRKASPGLSLDLSAVAKGYGADRLADIVASLTGGHCLVEIGGEVAVRGHGPGGRPWRIGVEHPLDGEVLEVLTLTPRAPGVATSGDYRNFYEAGGERFAHIIDPRSGRPVRHGLAAVTVVAASTAIADAWATALLVLGPEAGLRTAETEGIAALFGARAVDADGTVSLRVTASTALRALQARASVRPDGAVPAARRSTARAETIH